MRRFHSSASLSANNTDAAIAAIRAFRLYTLHAPVVTPMGYHHLRVHSDATAYRHQQVAEHLRGIEVSTMNPAPHGGDSLDQRQIHAGVVLRGQETIGAWRAELQKNIQDIARMSDVDDIGSWYWRIFGTTIGWGLISNLIQKGIHWQTVWPLLLLGQLFGSIDALPRYLLEKDNAFSMSQSMLDQTLSDLEQGRNPWFFFTSSYRNRLTLISPVWQSGFVNPQQLRVTDFMKTQSIQLLVTTFVVGSLIYQLLGRSLNTSFQTFQENIKPTWIVWDGLLTRDPNTSEPIMVLFIRLTEKRPTYPKRVPEKKWWWAFAPQPVPQPIPLPPQR